MEETELRKYINGNLFRCLQAFRHGLIPADAKVRLNWADFPMDFSRVQHLFRQRLNEKINLHIPYFSNFKKIQIDYQASLFRDSRRLIERIKNRVIVRQWETALFKRRFSHFLTTVDE